MLLITVLEFSIYTCCLVGLVSSNLSNPRKNGFVDGDIIIGALFPIHVQPTIENSYSRKCGEIREEYGMHRVEVLLKTINEINSNSAILPGVKLGVDIRDTCWFAPIALEQSIDFIINSIESIKLGENSSVYSLKSKKPIASLIGPASSTVTIQVQNLLQLFKIPQIGYSATTIDLSRKDEYKYFLRVVPSDELQVRVLLDLVSYFEWNYISVLNSIDNYGIQGMRRFLEQLKSRRNVCTDQELQIDNKEAMPKFREIALKLFSKDRAKVIVCFCQGDTVKNLLRAMIELNMTKQGYLIIGTDGWADRTDVLGGIINRESEERDLSVAAVGAITIRLYSKPIPDFDNYFRSKNYKSTEGNPWFQEFWEHKFQCYVNVTAKGKYNRLCYGNESLFNKDYNQDSKLGFVVKSVMTVAMGLHRLQKKLCKSQNNLCNKFLKTNGTLLKPEMFNVSFVAYDNETVSFDEHGDPPGMYEIMNYQYVQNKETGRNVFKYLKIGTWKDYVLTIEKQVQWPETTNGTSSPVKSFCSASCKTNEIRVITKDKKCCWKCKACSDTEFINITLDEEKCFKCEKGHLPTPNRTGCEEIEPSFIKWTDSASIVSVVFACTGILITAVITVIFAKYNDTPIVKSSTRELMYVILAGIALSYLTTFPLLYKPCIISCTLVAILPGFSFCLIYGSLVTKTNRICRILAISKKKIIRSKGRFLTTVAQIVIMAILNVVELIIIFFVIWLDPPKPGKVHPTKYITQLVCKMPDSSLFIPIGFDAILVCFCTWYAFKTRNLPENFNEAKFIGFTMYTTCIIWLGLVVTYFKADQKVISLCFAINLSATVAIVLLFIPKAYIILFRPEKNSRSAFTTTTEIKCHIGSGKTDYQCSKEKSHTSKSNSQQNLKFSTDLFRGSLNRNNNPDSYVETFCNSKFYNQEIALTYLEKDTKLTQTEFSLNIEFLFGLSNFLDLDNDDLNITQIALLQFLEENWNKDHIPQLTQTEFLDNSRPEILCAEEEFIDQDLESQLDNENLDTDNLSIKRTMLNQCNSVVTCSPISNVSTDASSTLTGLFLDYLQMHGKQFRSINDKRSVKL